MVGPGPEKRLPLQSSAKIIPQLPQRRHREEWEAAQTAWLAERKVSFSWWRCFRCLERKQVREDGWECLDCKVSCEQERIDLRERKESQRKIPAEVDEEA